MRTAVSLLLLVLILATCANSQAPTTPAPTATLAPPTETAPPTTTPEPTVPPATDTPQATDTPVPTDTPLSTETPLPPTDTAAPPTDTAQPTATAAPEPAQQYLGDVITQDNTALSALTVEDPAEPGILYEPASGTKLVAVEIIVANLSDEKIDVNPLNVELVDAEGFVYEAELTGRAEGLGTVDLFQGEKVRGWVSFQVPEEAVPARLKYALQLLGDEYVTAELAAPPEGYEPDQEVLDVTLEAPAVGLGETAQRDGYALTALTVDDPAEPGILYRAAPGTKLVAVEIVVANDTGAEPLDANLLLAYLVDTRGFVYRAQLGGVDDQMDSATLNQGEKAQGWIAFEIDADGVPLAVKYEEGMFSGIYLEAGLQ
jgi:hypothetical protein